MAERTVKIANDNRQRRFFYSHWSLVRLREHLSRREPQGHAISVPALLEGRGSHSISRSPDACALVTEAFHRERWVYEEKLRWRSNCWPTGSVRDISFQNCKRSYCRVPGDRSRDRRLAAPVIAPRRRGNCARQHGVSRFQILSAKKVEPK